MRFNDTMTVVKLKTNLQMLELQHNKNLLEEHAMLVKEATDTQAAAMWLKNGRAGASSSSRTPICSNCNTPGPHLCFVPKERRRFIGETFHQPQQQ